MNTNYVTYLKAMQKSENTIKSSWTKLKYHNKELH